MIQLMICNSNKIKMDQEKNIIRLKLLNLFKLLKISLRISYQFKNKLNKRKYNKKNKKNKRKLKDLLNNLLKIVIAIMQQ